MGQLSPSARALDQEMLIFEAGRASPGSNRPWQAMCGILMVLLCGPWMPSYKKSWRA